MPPLGKHYLEQWAEEDGTILDGALPPDTKHLTHKEYHQMDDVVYGGDVYFGPLWERIMTAFLEDHSGEAANAFEKELDEGQGLPSLKDRTKTELLDLEELVKLELIHLGLLSDPIEIRAGGSDEISLEMERLQTQLREQAQVNKLRKDIVYKKAKSWMALQEYNTLVDEMNKQIENVFNRRFVSLIYKLIF
jgi:transcriptional adapter 3